MRLTEHNVDWIKETSAERLDFELQNRVTEYLIDRDELAFRSIRIEVDHGTVTLSGRVRSYYEKQVATSCVKVVGVLNLINNLSVPEWEPEQNEHPFTL